MRQIGTVASEVLAVRFVDYMTTKEISAICEEDEGQWAIWVRDENDLDVAREELGRFEADPEDPIYHHVEQTAAEIRSAKSQRQREVKKNLIEMRNKWNAPLSRRAPLVFSMIVLCVVLAVLGGFDPRSTVHRILMFADPFSPAAGQNGLANILQGQVWRLLTPVFLHGDLMHIIFNMLWLQSLGSQIESKLGTPRFAAIVIFTGIFSNVAQFAVSGPRFLGMSGVVFGLFGFIWMRMVHDPSSAYQLGRGTIVLMIGVLILGFSGILDSVVSIANWAHLGGLVAGMIVGYLPEMFSSRRRT